ncbi:uncharacterized protein G2W53_015395 [Senna tora]|uniref:Uncharacterized protein n=1 Tax=Senna tora TaxID=362788 RepID=A0A834WVE8_9FABA|nr:uncharacterized protein G2W53_015395 [Senna tora]
MGVTKTTLFVHVAKKTREMLEQPRM